MTHLSLDDVVALNALIVTAIGLSFAFGRKGRKAPALDLKGRRTTAYDEIPPEQRVHHLDYNLGNNMGNRSTHSEKARAKTRQMVGARSPRLGGKSYGPNSYGAAALDRLEQEEANPQPATSRQLNVFFNWNGHTWDAYEVLGIPAGAGREIVIEAFHTCRTKSPDSTAFLQAATDSILKRS